MEKMKAALLEKYRTFKIKQLPEPEIKEDEVLVGVRFASICGTDQHIFTGDFHPRTQPPFIPGHEFAGVVENVGTKVRGFQIGDRVAVDPIIWCGEGDACKIGHLPACEKLRLIGIDQDGGFVQKIVVPPAMLFKVPEHVSHKHASLVEVYAIGFHACKRAGVQPGDSIAIFGGGKIGQCVMQAAHTKSIGNIFVVDIMDGRLDLIRKSYPEIRTINAMKENPVEVIRNETDGHGVDIAIEAVGHAEEIPGQVNPVRGCIQSIRGGGTVCVLGLGDDPAPVVFKELIWKEANIIASRVSHGEFEVAIENLAKGNLNPDAMISTVLPIDDIQDAFRLLEEKPDKYLKVLLDLNS